MTHYFKSLLVAALLIIPGLTVAAETTPGNSACGSSQNISTGDKLIIGLPGNPTTGYVWQATAVPAPLRQQGEPAHKADSHMLGAGGVTTFIFTANNQGSGKLELVYRRPWEKNKAPLKTCSIQVSVKPAQSCKSAKQAWAAYLSSTKERLEACFDQTLNNVTITLPNKEIITLPVAISASGARYSNNKQTFWEHQGVGRYFVDDKLVFEGQAEPAKEYNSGVKASILIETDVTSNGQKIVYPNTDKAMVTALKVSIAPGAETGWHKHLVPVYAYMVSGALDVELAGGVKKHYKAGDVIIEVVNTPHNGRNNGKEATVLAVFYTGVQGIPNVIRINQ